MTLAEVAESAKLIASPDGIDSPQGRIRFTDQFRQGVLETVRNFEADPEFKLPERVEALEQEIEERTKHGWYGPAGPNLGAPPESEWTRDHATLRRLRAIREGKP